MLRVYFESFIPEYGDYRHNLRNDQIRLPLIRSEYREMNVKYQMYILQHLGSNDVNNLLLL